MLTLNKKKTNQLFKKVLDIHTSFLIDGEYFPPSFVNNDGSNLFKPHPDMIRSEYFIFSVIDMHTSNLN